MHYTLLYHNSAKCHFIVKLCPEVYLELFHRNAIFNSVKYKNLEIEIEIAVVKSKEYQVLTEPVTWTCSAKKVLLKI